jgi:hypothetical protein
VLHHLHPAAQAQGSLPKSETPNPAMESLAEKAVQHFQCRHAGPAARSGDDHPLVAVGQALCAAAAEGRLYAADIGANDLGQFGNGA